MVVVCEKKKKKLPFLFFQPPSSTRLLACDDPLMPEIFDCIAQPWGLQLPCEAEQAPPGGLQDQVQVRVLLRGADGLPLNPEVPDRKALFLKVAELMPRHPNRSPEAVARRKAEEAARGRRRQGGGEGARGGGGGGAAAAAALLLLLLRKTSSKKKGRK